MIRVPPRSTRTDTLFPYTALFRSLAAEMTVCSLGGRLFRVEGGWEAAVQQACVVTLEPVAARLEGRLAATYETGHKAAENAAGGEIMVDPEADDPAETLPTEGIEDRKSTRLNSSH